MIEIFYSMLAAFIFAEIYHFMNRERLDLIFKKKILNSIKKMDVVFYISKTLSIFWPIIGLFSSHDDMFMLLIVVNLAKFALYHINGGIYRAYIMALPWINIAIYISILAYKIISIIR